MNAPHRIPVILTDAQYEDMTRKGAFAKVGRVELRGGVVVEMSPVHLNHSTAFGALYLAVAGFLRGAGDGLAVNGEVSIRFGQGFQPTADLVIWDTSRVARDLDGPLPGEAVKLVIEVADASLADDLGDKLADYAAAGLAEYWVVDVRARVIHCCAEPDQGAFKRRAVVRFGEPVTAVTIPLMLDTSAL